MISGHWSSSLTRVFPLVGRSTVQDLLQTSACTPFTHHTVTTQTSGKDHTLLKALGMPQCGTRAVSAVPTACEPGAKAPYNDFKNARYGFVGSVQTHADEKAIMQYHAGWSR